MSKKLLVLAATAAAILGLIVIPAVSAKDNKDVIVLSKNNLIVLNSQVDAASEAHVLSEAKRLDKSRFLGSNKDPVYLYLSTPGGYVHVGMEMIEGLNGLNRPVHTITSFAASMGFQLVQNLGNRYILKSGVLMSHRARGGVEGEFGGSDPSQLLNRIRIFTQQLTEMDEQTVRRTKGKQTLDSYQKAYANELWVTGQEAVEQGYADQVITIKCDDSLSGTTTHEASMFGLTILYDLSECPINSSPMNVRIGILTNKGQVSFETFKERSGGFGVTCLQEAVIDNQRVCATDTNLTINKIEEAKKSFLGKFDKSRNNVIPMKL